MLDQKGVCQVECFVAVILKGCVVVVGETMAYNFGRLEELHFLFRVWGNEIFVAVEVEGFDAEDLEVCPKEAEVEI